MESERNPRLLQAHDERQEQEEREKIEMQMAIVGREKSRILVVDDNTYHMEAITTMLDQY